MSFLSLALWISIVVVMGVAARVCMGRLLHLSIWLGIERLE